MNRVTNLLSKCVCGSTKFTQKQINKITCHVCECGLTRQVLTMTPAEVDEWYRETYHKDCYQHDYMHDAKVAEKRLRSYNLPARQTILDIGAGNCAFVDTAIAWGHTAIGVEPGKQCKNANCWNIPLEDVLFPTEHFDVITMHDVLEHVIDPVAMLKEVARIAKEGSKLVIDLPDWKHRHHWKAVEHLWMFDPAHVIKILEKLGYRKFGPVQSPVPSKKVITFERLPVKRVKILMPPGIGDIYWTLTKVRSFCEENNLGIPEVWIATQRTDRDRSQGYVEKVPFVKFGGYARFNKKDRKWRPLWKEAYMDKGRTIFTDVEGYDYFIAYNGVTRHGMAIDECDTEYSTEWDFPIYQTLEEVRYQAALKEEHGEYHIGYFIPHGMYKNWLAEFDIKKIYQSMAIISKQTGKKFLMIGAGWDATNFNAQLMKMDEGNGHLVDMIGKTSLDECFAALRGASGIYGFPSGITIMGASFGVPTLLLWNSYFVEKFWWNSVPPYTHFNTYLPMDTKLATVDFIPSVFERLLEGDV